MIFNVSIFGKLQVGSTYGHVVGAVPAIGIVITGSDFTSPAVVYVIDAAGGFGSCQLNEGTNFTGGVIGCYPTFPYPNEPTPSNSWVSLSIRQQSGNSNSYPGLLFTPGGAIVPGPYAPAIFNISGPNCAPSLNSSLQSFGPQSKTCSYNQPFVVNGDFFNTSSIITVGGVPCSATAFLSSTQLTCVSSNQLPSVTQYTIQVLQGPAISNQLLGTYLVGNHASTSISETSGLPLLMILLTFLSLDPVYKSSVEAHTLQVV